MLRIINHCLLHCNHCTEYMSSDTAAETGTSKRMFLGSRTPLTNGRKTLVILATHKSCHHTTSSTSQPLKSQKKPADRAITVQDDGQSDTLLIAMEPITVFVIVCGQRRMTGRDRIAAAVSVGTHRFVTWLVRPALE
jgi:hypothetical protein